LPFGEIRAEQIPGGPARGGFGEAFFFKVHGILG
jgi:hypothetical protein